MQTLQDRFPFFTRMFRRKDFKRALRSSGDQVASHIYKMCEVLQLAGKISGMRPTVHETLYSEAFYTPWDKQAAKEYYEKVHVVLQEISKLVGETEPGCSITKEMDALGISNSYESFESLQTYVREIVHKAELLATVCKTSLMAHVQEAAGLGKFGDPFPTYYRGRQQY